MLMNLVLEYAIEHQAATRAMLFSRGIPTQDLEDVYQYALVRILSANPRNVKEPAG